jgi:tRNA nucleotidyltransferase (CCA-adding enzyme)
LEQEQIPTWAIELIKQVERLNEKIPTHVEWVERNLKDHENRIRTLEQFRWMLLGMVGLAGLLGAVITKLLGL